MHPYGVRDYFQGVAGLLMVAVAAAGIVAGGFVVAQGFPKRTARTFTVSHPTAEFTKIKYEGWRDLYIRRSTVTVMATYAPGEHDETDTAALWIVTGGREYRIDCEDQATADKLALEIIRGPSDEHSNRRDSTSD